MIINFKLLGYNATTPLIQPKTTNHVRIDYQRVLLKAFQLAKLTAAIRFAWFLFEQKEHCASLFFQAETLDCRIRVS